MSNLIEIKNRLCAIDPTRRARWLEASEVLRAIPDGEALWLEWSMPLSLPDEVVQLWREMQPTPCADPVAALTAIAKRKTNQ